MNKFVIISDASMDLPKETRLKYEIEFPVAGALFKPDGTAIEADLEYEKTTPEYFFTETMKDNIKTSLPNQFEIVSRLEPFLQNGQDILAIVLSTGISGTYNSFIQASNELLAKYKDRKIYVVDSLRYSSAVGLLCVYASIFRKEGKSIEEIRDWLEVNKLNLHQAGVLDDLKFLARNGKITGLKALMGTMVGVKPVADFSNETGQPAPLGNVRGYKKAYKFLSEYMKRTIGNPKGKIFVVEHSMRPEQAEHIRQIVEENFHPETIIMTRTGQFNGTNIGPGLATAFYIADKPVSKNLEEELKIFQDITSNLQR